MSTNEVITPTANQSVSTPMMEAIQPVTRQGPRALQNYNQSQEWKLISLRECATPGASGGLQWKATLSPPHWQDAGPFQIGAVPAVWTEATPLAATRYYRAVLDDP